MRHPGERLPIARVPPSHPLIAMTIVPRHARHEQLRIALIRLGEKVSGARPAQYGCASAVVGDHDILAARLICESGRGAHAKDVISGSAVLGSSRAGHEEGEREKQIAGMHCSHEGTIRNDLPLKVEHGAIAVGQDEVAVSLQALTQLRVAVMIRR
ncbi:hypothetical protein HDC95_003295 [Microbacterium sp. AK031]|nr:hypothetical protein [Microbacterium sp. AK031]